MSVPRAAGVILLLAAAPLCAQPADTKALATHLRAVREKANFGDIRREFVPWIDTRILRGDSISKINQELAANKLFRRPPETVDFALIGYLDQIKVHPAPSASDLLLVQFGVGMACAYDQGLIVYQRSPLRRIGWIDTGSVEVPMHFSAVVAGEVVDGRHLLAFHSFSSWCSSSLADVQMQIWSIGEDSLQLLLNRKVHGRRWFAGETVQVDSNLVTLRYDGIVVPAVERYRIDKQQLTRVAPIAATVLGFIHEWLNLDDEQAARWSTPEAARTHHEIAAWAANLPLQSLAGPYDGPARCAGRPRMWEVELRKMGSDPRLFRVSENGAEKLQMTEIVKPPIRFMCPAVSLDGVIDRLPN